MWLLLAYAFFFVLMMTLVAKKGDRYILPIFPALDVLAAFGILVIGSLIGHWSLVIGHFKLLPKHILGGAAVLYLIITVWSYHPYALAYSNPLFADNLSQELGWGEGLDQIAKWFDEHASQAVVASWYPEELGAYTSAHVAHINAHEQGKVEYVVLYRNMFGRAPDHYANDFIDEYYKKREPVFVAHVAGKEFAWVYKKWSFDEIVGELTPGRSVQQVVAIQQPQLTGVDVLVATYSGRAKSGKLLIAAREAATGEVIETWQVPVSEIENDRWLTVHLSKPLAQVSGALRIEISAEGTRPGDAPTVRYTRLRDYRAGEITIDGQERPGDAAVRLRYETGQGQEATEEDTRLLSR